MPEYSHQCQAEECKHEWEDTYSIKVDPPKICPKCGQETAKRMISLNGRGIVELTGDELVKKVKEDAQVYKKEVYKSEKLYSSLIGEDKYQSLQQSLDNGKRNRGNY